MGKNMPPDKVKLSKRKIESILHDPEKSAAAINLTYVNDRQPGIQRKTEREQFHYYDEKKKLTDKDVLERIKKLAIPPAWEDVWICKLDNGHLQATGVDIKKRKQYKYHTLWNSLRNHTKFYRLHEFGEALPGIRARIKQDLAHRGLPVEKVLATVVCLMEQTSIRIGNSAYQKLYGSFGLTTLTDKHVRISGDNMQFIFRGKKGIAHNISIKNKRLAKIVKNCQEIPGKELFQYYDNDGNHKTIDSGMVNAYLREITGKDFTAKDFRTWAGSVRAITAFSELGVIESATDIKKNMIAVLDYVAEHLGNTRTVCKKYYVHPAILALYESNRLHEYLNKLQKIQQSAQDDFSGEEQLLMMILEKEGLTHLS